jgi:hypothetical protein
MAAVMLFRNGVLQTLGIDYAISGPFVTMVTPPGPGDVLTARVFAIGKDISNPTRYVAPWTVVLAGAFDGVAVLYEMQTGPTILGILDGINNLFTWQVAFPRVQIFRNGILQTQGVDVNAGTTAMVFTPSAIPQPGDALTLLGYGC